MALLLRLVILTGLLALVIYCLFGLVRSVVHRATVADGAHLDPGHVEDEIAHFEAQFASDEDDER